MLNKILFLKCKKISVVIQAPKTFGLKNISHQTKCSSCLNGLALKWRQCLSRRDVIVEPCC